MKKREHDFRFHNPNTQAQTIYCITALMAETAVVRLKNAKKTELQRQFISKRTEVTAGEYSGILSGQYE